MIAVMMLVAYCGYLAAIQWGFHWSEVRLILNILLVYFMLKGTMAVWWCVGDQACGGNHGSVGDQACGGNHGSVGDQACGGNGDFIIIYLVDE